jgi:glycosyltransferase involved in cell wall biosynthesis
MDNKLLSIILVSKNNHLDVKYTLDSLNGIEKLNYEILVVDSSNTLLIKNLLNEYKHFSNIKYFWTQPKGIYNAMNLGLKMSAEKSYIWFLNPGDVLLSLEYIKQVLQKFNELEIDYCIAQSVYANKPYLQENFFPKKGVEISLENFASGILNFSHQSTFVDKKVFRDGILFDENYSIAADFKLQCELVKYYKGVLMPIVLVKVDVLGVSHKKITKTSLETSLILYRAGYFSILDALKNFIFKFFKRLFTAIMIRIFNR